MKIGVVGNGFVGHAMTLLRPHIEVLVWDLVPKKRDPESPKKTFFFLEKLK